MNIKKKYQEGQGELVSFILLIFFSALVLSLFYHFNVFKILSSKTLQEYQYMNEAEELISIIEKDFQILADANADTNDCMEIGYLCGKYSDKNLKIKDISSGININCISEKFLEDKNLQKLFLITTEKFSEFIDTLRKNKWLNSSDLINQYLTDFGKKNITYYGWVNPSFLDCNLMNLIEDGKSKENSFIIKDFPLLNVYFTAPEIINFFVTHNEFKISQSEEKYDKLIDEISLNPYLTRNRIKEILDVKDNNSILDILGTKTQFWEVSFNTEYSNIKMVIATIKDKEERYIYKVIKREINYEEVSY